MIMGLVGCVLVNSLSWKKFIYQSCYLRFHRFIRSHYCQRRMIPIVFVAIAVYFFATTLATSGHLAMKMHADHLKHLNETNYHQKKPPSSVSQFNKYRFVCASVVLYVLAGCIDLSVNRLIPFYIRSCFAALDIPLYVIMARVALSETLDGKQTVGVLVALIGCACAVALGAHPVEPRTRSEIVKDVFSYRVGVLVAVTIPVFAIAVYFVRDTVRHASQEFMESNRLFILTCAVFASSYTATWASLLVRVVSEFVHFSILDATTICTAIALVLLSVAQLATMADMHALFKSVVSMPFYLILNAAGIVVLSAIIFNEIPNHVHLFGLSMVLGFVGIALIVHKAPEELEEGSLEDHLDEENQALIHVRE